MRILVTGSLAYDNIMNFPGQFSDHILPKKIHILNVGFLIDEVRQNFGGTAGNIAYTLSLLGLRPHIFACAGNDFGVYKKWLLKKKIDTKKVNIIQNENTASAHIITDKEDNQITAFHPAAMKHNADTPTEAMIKKSMIGIIAPSNVSDMVTHSKRYKQKKLPYIFDPGQQIPALSKSQLNACITGAKMLIVNDYELSMVLKKMEMKKSELKKKVEILVTTLGELGSIIESGGKKIEIPSVKAKKVVDPTGAGDAYRAGFIAGLVKHDSLEKAGRMGSVAAVYAVENQGTQAHGFTQREFWGRYKENFEF